jgi:hydrogenase-4 component E
MTLLQAFLPWLDLSAVLLLAFALAGLVGRTTSGIFAAYAGQSLALAGILALLGVGTGRWPLLALAAFTALGKAWLVPRLLRRRLHRELLDRAAFGSYLSAPAAMLTAAVLLACSFILLPPAAAGGLHLLLVAGVTTLLFALAAMSARREALPQVLSFFLGENGVIAAVAALIYDFPFLPELGLFLDLWLAALVLGVLIRRMYERLGSTDVSRLNRLRG